MRLSSQREQRIFRELTRWDGTNDDELKYCDGMEKQQTCVPARVRRACAFFCPHLQKSTFNGRLSNTDPDLGLAM
jgi:hypothetical protein